MSFADNLLDIHNELNAHNRSSVEAMSSIVSERLDSSFKNYTTQIEQSMDYLMNRKNSIHLLYRIGKG